MNLPLAANSAGTSTSGAPFMSAGMKGAPEVDIPANVASLGTFMKTCPADIQKVYTAIWTDLTK